MCGMAAQLEEIDRYRKTESQSSSFSKKLMFRQTIIGTDSLLETAVLLKKGLYLYIDLVNILATALTHVTEINHIE